MLNPCIVCGKERVDGKSWKEKSGASLVTYTLTICPDSVCQKIVEKGIADRKAKKEDLAKKKAESKLQRENSIAIS